MVDLDGEAEQYRGGAFPAGFGHYRFRPERVHRRAALLREGKSLPHEPVTTIVLHLRRNCTPPAIVPVRVIPQRNIFHRDPLDGLQRKARAILLRPICTQR
jgi:hypothetical protein